jgi:hypothetical protein
VAGNGIEGGFSGGGGPAINAASGEVNHAQDRAPETLARKQNGD